MKFGKNALHLLRGRVIEIYLITGFDHRLIKVEGQALRSLESRSRSSPANR
jgi:hypothetical protein